MLCSRCAIASSRSDGILVVQRVHNAEIIRLCDVSCEASAVQSSALRDLP